MQVIAQLLIVMNLVLLLLAATTPAAAQRPGAPFGLEEVTTPELTSERFVAALPTSFDGVPLEPAAFGPIEDHLHGFPTTSEEFFYVGPTEEWSIWVIINDLGAEPSVVSAISGVAYALMSDAEFTIEAQDTTTGARVPYLLANQNGTLHAIVWGARDGDWVFSVLTPNKATREEFVRAVVANLNGEETSSASAELVTPPDLPPATTAPQPTETPRPKPTPTATTVPTSTPTVTTRPPSDATSTPSGSGGVATTAPVMQVENDPDLVYGEIYTVSLHCDEVQQRWQGGINGYCSWPRELPASQAACIPDDRVPFGSGQSYLCKSRYTTADVSHPDEITVYNAPEEIYSVEVRCTNVIERNGVIYGDCDVPWYQAGMNDCIESDKYTWGDTKIFLCKP